MNVSLAPGEPLSPELVLVLPPELRAQVLALLPTSAGPPPHVLAATPVDDPAARPLGRILVSRAVQLTQVFVAVTILTLAMSLIANAVR